tara:strand:+ start:11575 stop:12048 length:474 start_codon:yes stop_codon:yes gene_type:complete
MDFNEKIFLLNSEGLSPSRIAQKMKIKKAVVLDILGESANKGLGTKITDVTKALGLDVVAETVAGALGADDCGCAKRAEDLNKLFPNRSLNDLSNEDFNYLTEFFKSKRSSVSPKEQKELVGIFNNIFNSKRVVSNCSPCVANLIKDLKKIYGATNN